jgi:hypothetical protein
MAGSARDEAERLVAAVLARAVTGQAFGERWATGEPECCVCPVCKAIAAMRDPKPETAARLAGSAGDLAGSVAGLLRSVSAIMGERSRPAPPPPPKPEPNPDEMWSAATRADRARVIAATDRAAGAAHPAGGDRNRADQAWSAATNGGGAAAPGGAAGAGGEPGGAVGTGGEPGGVAGAGAGGAAGAGGEAAGGDPWAAATTVSNASAAATYAAELAERRAAALLAAAEAERRVAEAAALAKARREAAAAAGSGPGAGDETDDTAGRVARDPRTPRRFDVWAEATADAGVASVASGTTVDHDDAGATAPAKADDGATGDEARGDGAA